MRKHAAALATGVVSACPSAYAPTVRIATRALAAAPAFGRVYAYCRRYNVWPDPVLSVPRMAPIAAFAHLPLPNLPTDAALAEWLALPQEALSYYADPRGRHEAHEETAVNHYHYHLLAKSTGGVRLIEAPKQRLKTFQRRILRGILAHVPPHRDAFGFVRGRNCLDAAQRHANEEVVICLDIRHFFPSVRAMRIFGLFGSLGYPEAVARSLTGLCTSRTPTRILGRLPLADRALFSESHLPQGAPTSPALANLTAYRLDCRLAGLAHRLDAQFSRYADDITFSGARSIAPMVLQTADFILRDEGFAPHPHKTRIMSQGTRQTVTGVVVNKHVNTSRANFDRLKAVVHALGKPGDARLDDPATLPRLLGEIGWVEAVNPARGAKLRHLLAVSLSKRRPT
ncbi:reverse transcriptase family protein [Cognatiyoonia sp. IB215182]|uniref:reverse transcriptase family protein n=1 Tax=Cognatiyoonia sp. IB215182 TaxID=3097353 RepID=UPI002A0C6E5F|nr:reverse transcriptase family protein [Cognatiyoonia sp. IB215182]MDX8351290.1 reverse transcriptase family protein [Cognatiyoonia sp. IB215182]